MSDRSWGSVTVVVMVVMAAAAAMGVVVWMVVTSAGPGTMAHLLDDRPFDAHGAFDLQGGVGDVVLLEQEFLDTAQHPGLFPLELRLHVHMGGEGEDVGADG